MSDIVNAKDQEIGLNGNASNLPDVSPAVFQFMQPVTIGIMQKAMVEGKVRETPIYYSGQAVKQAFKPKQLEIKPEGQRSWSWFKMHISGNIPLKNDDRFVLNGVKYRVMNNSNYSEYGYIEYDIIQDYQP